VTDFITKEDIDRLKARDMRFRDIELAIRVDEELRDSVVVNLILEAATRRSETALEQLAFCNPADTLMVASYQAEVRCARFIVETLRKVRENGIHAAASLDEEGEIELEREAHD
jgi:hypothetical protein